MDAKSLVHQTDDIDAGQYVAVGSWSTVSGPFEVSPKITKAKSQMPKCKKPGKISGMKIAFVLWQFLGHQNRPQNCLIAFHS